jgi:transposase
MILLYEDESRIHAYQALRSTWFQKGKPKQVPTFGHHASVRLFGAVNVLNGDFLCQVADNCKVPAFHSFMKYVLDYYPDKVVMMVLDRARIHDAKELQPFFEQHEDRLIRFFLPKYSPNLNPVERIWKWLKETVIQNRFHPNKAAIKDSVSSFLAFLEDAPEQILKRIVGVHMPDY